MAARTVVLGVGSENAAKLRSVQLAVEQIQGSGADLFNDTTVVVRPSKTDSLVAAQPMSDEETLRGATNRAHAVLASHPDVDYGIGIEGGIQKVGERYLECGFVVVVRRDGRTGVGTSARYELSRAIIECVEAGAELGDVMDAISGETGVRSKGGAMGLLSAGILPRDVCYAHGVIFAFAPFLSDPRYFPAS